MVLVLKDLHKAETTKKVACTIIGENKYKLKWMKITKKKVSMKSLLLVL